MIQKVIDKQRSAESKETKREMLATQR